MALIVPHLSRAIGMQFRLMDRELRIAASLAALDRLQSGVFIIGPRGRLLHRNSVAERLLQRGDALCVGGPSSREPRLTTVDPADARDLDAAIEESLAIHPESARHFSRVMRVNSLPGGPVLNLQISPLPIDNQFGDFAQPALAILFVTESGPSGSGVLDRLNRLYGLTPAEGLLALALSEGKTLAEYAASRGVSYQTVRTQLRTVFEKTGVSRQAELVKLMLSLKDPD